MPAPLLPPPESGCGNTTQPHSHQQWPHAVRTKMHAAACTQRRRYGALTRPDLPPPSPPACLLQPDTVPSMLAEAASVSSPGSTFMASLITEESLAWLKQRGGRQQASSSSSSSAGAGAGEGSGEQQQKGRSGQSQRGRGQSLTSKFIWGCPGDVGEVSAATGHCCCMVACVVGHAACMMWWGMPHA